MATIVTNSFTSFQLSTQEEEAGSILSELQKMVLQTKLSGIAEEKLNLAFDPLNPQGFIQREAELTGQMNIIKWLLDTSYSVESALALKQAAKD